MPRRSKRVLLLLLLLAALSAVSALGAWRMSRARPDWYSPPDRQDARAAALAEKTEYAVLEESHKVRPDDLSWSVVVRDEQVNAWLATRLPQWAAHDESLAWLAAMGTLQVRTDQLGISIAVAGTHSEGDRVFIARVQPRLEHERLALTVDRVWLGQLTLPGAPLEAVLSRLADWAPREFLDQPAVEQTIDLLFSQSGAGGGGGQGGIDPVLRLDDGRRVRLVDLQCVPGQLLLKCQTLPPAESTGTKPQMHAD